MEEFGSVKESMNKVRAEFEDASSVFCDANFKDPALWFILHEFIGECQKVVASIKDMERKQEARLRNYIRKQKLKEAKKERKRLAKEQEMTEAGVINKSLKKSQRGRRGKKGKKVDQLEESMKEMQKIKQKLRKTKTRQRKIFKPEESPESEPCPDVKEEKI